MLRQRIIISFVLFVVASSVTGCYMYHEREKVLIEGIDIDQTLDVAEIEMAKNEFGTVLTIWAVRDQIFNGSQAARVSDLYFLHIERIDSEDQKARDFSVWHLTWAVSNVYRMGDEDVRAALREAYEDAEKRVEKLDKRIAKKMFGGDKIYMGDAHGGGRAYARSHLVVPGNEKYLQSAEEFREKEKTD
ncbi:MAG: hypothetical protein GY854_24295 [Deltaproteobacteria bacterium]|nr:hypothetical protein [Deltaproteobacteria bacterium]